MFDKKSAVTHGPRNMALLMKDFRRTESHLKVPTGNREAPKAGNYRKEREREKLGRKTISSIFSIFELKNLKCKNHRA